MTEAGRSEEGSSEALSENSGAEFRSLIDPDKGLEDGRRPWDWRSKYRKVARPLIRREAFMVTGYFALFLGGAAISGALQGQPLATGTLNIDPRLLLIFFSGGLGGTTFSIKWLMHSVATGKWHLDRIYWRIFVPLVSGVYALVVLHLFSAGMVGSTHAMPSEIGSVAALAFLVGYFSDGVSGLLTNIANAVFGTVEKK